MNEATKTLCQLKKASKLTRLAFRKNGPKSYKRGQGALLNALLGHEGSTQRDLVKILDLNRSDLKDIVKKAERNGYVSIEDVDAKRTYAVKLTAEGREVAEKRAAAHGDTATDIVNCLSEEEKDQLNAITEKLILSCKEKGISGKKKGRKAHHHGSCQNHAGSHHDGRGTGHAHHHGHGHKHHQEHVHSSCHR